MSKFHVGLVLTVLIAAGTDRSSAQNPGLTTSRLVQGQPLRITVDGAVPPADAVFLASVAGSGPGTCFPNVGLCIDLLDPWIVAAVLPVDFSGRAVLESVVPAGFPLLAISFQAVVVAYEPSGITLSETNTVDTSIETLAAFDDTFAGSSLSNEWTNLHPSLVQINVLSGSVEMTPTAGGPAVIWFENNEGPMIAKEIQGDFIATATAHTHRASNPALPVPTSYRLAGILARDPASAPSARNSVHVALGAGVPGQPNVVEDKSTDDSQSVFFLHSVPSQDAELRLERQGTIFTMSWRPVAGFGAFQVIGVHNRPDLPPLLEVGLMVYSFEASPDITAVFDDIEFQ